MEQETFSSIEVKDVAENAEEEKKIVTTANNAKSNIYKEMGLEDTSILRKIAG